MARWMARRMTDRMIGEASRSLSGIFCQAYSNTMWLSALRESDEDAPRSPAPSLDRLDELVRLTGAAGLTVTTEVVGQRKALPAAVDLADYRIVQESLTNVARHAGPAAARVRINFGERELTVDDDDDGRPPTSNGIPQVGSGNGIAGMRERAVALGGSLETGHRPGGGFGVSARLPVNGAR